MTQRQAAAQCTGHATTNWLQRYNATARSSSRQHHVRVADLRCTVSSCFGKHLRFITHRIYWYLLLLLFCFVRHKTQMHVTAHNCSAYVVKAKTICVQGMSLVQVLKQLLIQLT